MQVDPMAHIRLNVNGEVTGRREELLRDAVRPVDDGFAVKAAEYQVMFGSKILMRKAQRQSDPP